MVKVVLGKCHIQCDHQGPNFLKLFLLKSPSYDDSSHSMVRVVLGKCYIQSDHHGPYFQTLVCLQNHNPRSVLISLWLESF